MKNRRCYICLAIGVLLIVLACWNVGGWFGGAQTGSVDYPLGGIGIGFLVVGFACYRSDPKDRIPGS